MVLTPDLAESLTLAQGFLRGNGQAGPRIPMVFQCTEWVKQGLPPVALRVNPHVVTFKQPKRISRKDTQGGTAFFHWTDAAGFNNDILELEMRGRTGNIRNRPSPSALDGVVVPKLQAVANWLNQSPPGAVTDNPGAAKHYSWARLYQLSRAPMINLQTGERNQFDLLYQSPLFPAPLLFTGFFSKILDFSESAESPNMVEYSLSFTVQNCLPSLDTIAQYLTVALASPAALEQLIAQQVAETTALIGFENSGLTLNGQQG